MGSANIIVLVGVYIVLGLYALGFSGSELSRTETSIAVANNIQAEQIARSGVSLMIAEMGTDSLFSSSEHNRSILGGNVTYSVLVGPTVQSTVQAVGLFSGSTSTLTATCVYDRGRWRVARLKNN